jgi:CBS domain-containing protein
LSRRESYRRSLREKGPFSLKMHHPKKIIGEIMKIAKTTVVTMAPTTPVYDAVQIMSKRGFRRIPIATPSKKRLTGIITAMDIVNYLGGGEKFEIVQKKFSGNFYKAINESVKAIMIKKVISTHVSAKISQALRLMKNHNVGGLPIIDDEEHVKGIITERDIVAFFAAKVSGMKVEDIMTTKVVTALPHMSIIEVEKTMVQNGFRRLPIVSQNEIIGIVTVMDIIRFFGSGEAFRHLKSGTLMQVLHTKITEIATKNVVVTTPDMDIGETAQIMQKKNIGALPVVHDGKLTGIITERDFFKIIK